MADTEYTYSISSDFPNHQVDSNTLTEEILASSISSASLLYIETESDDCDIWFDDPLSGADQTTLDGVVAAHTGDPESTVGQGGVSFAPLDTPGTPTVTPQGASGSTTWGYKITGFSESGETLASIEGQTTTGNATLDDTNFNRVTWPAVDGASKYAVYRSTAGGTPSSTGKIVEVSAEAAESFDDTGQAASGSEPSEDKSCLVVIDGVGVNGFLPEFDQAASDGESSTTSTAWQQKLRLSVTNVPAGTYRIGVCFGWGYSDRSNDFGGRVQVDDTTTVWEMRQEPKDSGRNQVHPAAGFAYVVLSEGDHDIDIDYRCTSNNDTARIRNARLEFWRVA